MVFGHGLEARYVELAEKVDQRRRLPGERATAAHGHLIVLGVEDDHPALFHIGVDLGQR